MGTGVFKAMVNGVNSGRYLSACTQAILTK